MSEQDTIAQDSQPDVHQDAPAPPQGALARVARLARSAPIVLRRHGPVTLGWSALRWLSGQRGYFLRDLLMDTPDFRALPDTLPGPAILDGATGQPERRPLALCISGVGRDAMRYRCAHLAEQLAREGYHADVVTTQQANLSEALTRYQVFVLHRVMAAPDYLAFVAEAQRRGKVVIFDTDDLVFDVALLDQMPGVETFSRVERQYIADTIRRNGRLLRACDAVTVSTAFLRDYLLKTGAHQRVFFLPNVMSAAMLQGAEDALAAAQAPASAANPPQDTVTIGYFSGTSTHNRDFLAAADALLWALERYPQTRLQIVGPLMLDQRFTPYDAAGRVTRLPLQPWQRLPSLYTLVDIAIAPLERNNPFTEAKSCIKYLEAALCRVPTIASPRSDFRRVIAPGRNGLIADTPAEWRAALAQLVESPDERLALGAQANTQTRASETTAARAEATCALYRTLAPAAFARPPASPATPAPTPSTRRD